MRYFVQNSTDCRADTRRRRSPFSPAAAALLVLAPALAHAQAKPAVEVSVTTDERRRGLSWSDGDASASASVDLQLTGLNAGARVTALRGSARHAGADMVTDLTLGTGFDQSGVRLNVSAIGHLFTGANDRMDYGEVAADASYTFGPLQVEAGANYAPSQRSIGGSNFYLFAGANAGIPATPFTVSASLGRSIGSDNGLRSDRLRPGGDYSDWRIGVDHVTGPLTVGLDYTGTNLSDGMVDPIGDRRNSGKRLLARAQFSF
jgi:uncharacterized protein (TIGR02001 family)